MLKHSNLTFKWVERTLISSFDDFYYFYLVVKHGGFSAASEAENISKSKLLSLIHISEPTRPTNSSGMP
ncbi:hypothetical protein ACN6QF_15940, partial [Acinetobacter baumannii]